jgi:hypothetical protein
MTKFYEKLNDLDKEKYLKDIKKNIDTEKYPKVQDFILNNDLYISNVKTNPINYNSKDLITILDNSQNRWFILCIDGKISLIAKKNIIIHTDNFDYVKRDSSFNKKYKIKKADYLVEYIENIGANLSLGISNYNDKIGKNKWENETQEITNMLLHSQIDNSLNGYTYNGSDFSLCSIGKNYNKGIDILS